MVLGCMDKKHTPGRARVRLNIDQICGPSELASNLELCAGNRCTTFQIEDGAAHLLSILFWDRCPIS